MIFSKSFQPRSAERDRANDAERFRRVEGLFNALLSEIHREQDGLRRRYRSEQGDASMALAVDEGGETSVKLKTRLETLEKSMGYCEQRLQTLAHCSEAIERLREAAAGEERRIAGDV